MTCDDCDLLLAAHAVGALDAAEDRRLQLHLAGCRGCQAAAAAYLQTADLLPLTLDPATPSPALRSRLLAQVHAEAAGQRAVGAPRVPWRQRLWQALPAARGLTLAGGIASLAAVALAVWSFAIPHSGRPVAPPVLVSRACGLTTMPSACGELTYTASTHQTVVTVEGLPALAQTGQRASAAYAVWLIHSGTPRLGGYLTEAPDGRTWSAVVEGDSTAYDFIATTQEPRIGSPVPTGPELLRIDRPMTPARS